MIRQLVPLPFNKIQTVPSLPRLQKCESKLKLEPLKAQEFVAARATWIRTIRPPEVPTPALLPIKGVRLTKESLAKLRTVVSSTAPTAQMLALGVGPNQLFGVLHTSLNTYEYTLMLAEYKRQRAAITGPVMIRMQRQQQLDGQWQKVLAAAREAFAGAGLARFGQPELDEMATVLNRSKQSFNTVATIANTGSDPIESTEFGAVGGFVPETGTVTEPTPSTLVAPETLCERPIEGSFTKHFSRSFELKVRLRVWCPTWTKPRRTCLKTFRIAGVSFAVDLGVGYRVTCCGAVAWGQAAVEACGSVLGAKVCAHCTARIAGVTGTGRSLAGKVCNYGLGLVAELQCSLGGVNLLYLNVPFGWTITGPCPPPQLKC